MEVVLRLAGWAEGSVDGGCGEEKTVRRRQSTTLPPTGAREQSQRQPQNAQRQ